MQELDKKKYICIPLFGITMSIQIINNFDFLKKSESLFPSVHYENVHTKVYENTYIDILLKKDTWGPGFTVVATSIFCNILKDIHIFCAWNP